MSFYFTPTGLKKLDLEIERLETQLKKVQAGSGEIAELGGNAWHDNAGYDALVIDLRGINKRRSDIQVIRNQAHVVVPPNNPQAVTLGTRVTFSQNDERVTVAIVGYGQSNPDKNLIAYDTPFGKFLKGLKKNETKSGQIGEDLCKVTILEIETLSPEHEGLEK